jgi:RNA polymerase sigma-70 factor (ECF subfamily)
MPMVLVPGVVSPPASSEARRSSPERVRQAREAWQAGEIVVAREAALRESALVARLRLGDEDAYETLVRTYGRQMLAVARGYLASQEDAEDVLQTAFVLVFRFIHGFSGDSRLSTWMHRIVVNCSLMRLRNRMRHPEERLNLSAFEDRVAALAAPPGPSVLDELVRTEPHERLLRAVGRLPDMVRAAVQLRLVDGLTLTETSLLLGRSVTAVKSSVQLGRIALRSMLAAVAEEPEPEGERHALQSGSATMGGALRDGRRGNVSATGALHIHHPVLSVLPALVRPGPTASKVKRVAPCAWSAASHGIEPGHRGDPGT